jgi:hypothetical protein
MDSTPEQSFHFNGFERWFYLMIDRVQITGFVYFILPQVWGIKLNGITP